MQIFYIFFFIANSMQEQGALNCQKRECFCKCISAYILTRIPSNLCMLTYYHIHICILLLQFEGPSLPWSYGNWIYNYLSNRCLSLLMLWVRILIRTRCTTICDKVCQWLATGQWFSPVSSTNKTDRHDITEILLKVTLNTIKQTNNINTIKNTTTVILYLNLSFIQQM